MKKSYRNLLRSGIMCTALLFGATACTDDHFDVQSSTVSGGKTLWQNIQEQPDLKNFAQILSRVTVVRSDFDKTATLKYSDYLNNPQYLTVWAPVDETYNAQQWLDSLDKVDAYRAEAAANPEKRDSLIRLALNLEYKIGDQFVGNHIARFNHEANPGEQEVHMLNSKICLYDASKSMFNNVPLLDGGVNKFISSNGALHLLGGLSPYAYNLYNFMEAYPQFSSISNYIKSADNTVFSAYSSTPGAMDNNGQMQYVDSIFVTTNSILSNAGASISNEDSMYVAIIPTNTGWEQAVAKAKSLYKYGDKYNYNYNKNSFGSTALLNADSLTNLESRSAIISSMFISANSIAGMNETVKRDSAAFVDLVLLEDSLKATDGVVYYNQAGESGVKNPVLAAAKVTKASNGYVFALDDYTIDPAYSWQKRLVFSAFNQCYSNSKTVRTISLSSETKNDTIPGELPDGYYVRCEHETSMSGGVDVDFALRGVLSGKYRIKVFLLPSHANKNYSDSLMIGKKRYKEEIKVTARVLLDTDDATNPSAGIFSDEVIVSDKEVKAYTLINKATGLDYFEFDKCYANLPSTYTDCFARLRLSIGKPNSRTSKANAINVGQIILEPVRE